MGWRKKGILQRIKLDMSPMIVKIVILLLSRSNLSLDPSMIWLKLNRGYK